MKILSELSADCEGLAVARRAVRFERDVDRAFDRQIGWHRGDNAVARSADGPRLCAAKKDAPLVIGGKQEVATGNYDVATFDPGAGTYALDEGLAHQAPADLQQTSQKAGAILAMKSEDCPQNADLVADEAVRR
jgi:hypothetical protein